MSNCGDFVVVQVPPTPPSTPEPQGQGGHHEQQRQQQQQQWQFAWQTRELCLHYFSNSVKFKFGQDTHDVYRVDQIKEWAELENPIWLDNLREKLFTIAGHFIHISLFSDNLTSIIMSMMTKPCMKRTHTDWV